MSRHLGPHFEVTVILSARQEKPRPLGNTDPVVWKICESLKGIQSTVAFFEAEAWEQGGPET